MPTNEIYKWFGMECSLCFLLVARMRVCGSDSEDLGFKK
jgi:hypothetical protein